MADEKEEAEMTDWQSIESAPKDGREFLAVHHRHPATSLRVVFLTKMLTIPTLGTSKIPATALTTTKTFSPTGCLSRNLPNDHD